MIPRLLLALLLAAPLAAKAQEGLHDRPTLALDPGMHTARLWRADVDREGRFVVTGSDDKTVRVWSAEDGRLLRTIRMPAGPGNVGKIYAVAISPDGETIAAGGWTAPGPPNPIYLFDRSSGALKQRIERLPNVVHHLVFSSDGRRLAAVLWSGGLRVYDAEAGFAEIARDKDYGDQSYGAAFAADGRLATSSLDGKIRLYDAAFRRVQMVQAPGGERPYGVAFSPDGERLAVGYEDSTAVDLLDGRTLDVFPGPDVSGVDNGNLGSVAWSLDGRTLFAGGFYSRSDGIRPVFAWAANGRGLRKEFAASQDTIMTLAPLEGGDLLVAATDPYLIRLNPSGESRWVNEPPKADLRDQDKTLAVSYDGRAVDFGYLPWGEEPARFDLDDLALSLEPPDDGMTARPKQDDMPIVGWKNTPAPLLDGEPLPLRPYETSRSLAIHPDGERFLLGAEWFLYAFDAAGETLWRQPAPGTVWAVNVSGDGRLAVAAYGDGTIRWRDMADGKELLAFLPLADKERWVAWTPEGYFASSAVEGTGEILGWHVNRGWDQAADFYPISAFPGFHQPDVLKLVLQEGETARALGIAKIARDRKRVQELAKSAAPPGAQLHALTIGVSDYANHDHLKLDFADDDATDIANALMRQEGPLYAKVNIQRLVDGDATQRAVYQALNAIRSAVKPEQEDVAVIHFSGHGAEVDGDYYLLPNDVDATDNLSIQISGIDVNRFKDFLRKIGEHGKVLVLLDACHSGNVKSGVKDGLPPDVEAIRRELAAAGNGVAVLTSSTGREKSKESVDWKNGAFTEAVLEAIDGKADHDGDGWISTDELQGYVHRRVRELTEGAQNPRVSALSDHLFQSRLFALIR